MRVPPEAAPRFRPALFVGAGLLALGVAGAGAQQRAGAPVEERRAGGNAVLAGQQAVEFARRELSEAEDRARRAEAEARDAAEITARMKTQYEDARRQSEARRREADAEKARVAQARARLDKAAAEFDRLRRQGGGAKK